MTILHFYQGLRTIGGTIAEIETDTARCLFDFGVTDKKGLSAEVLLRPGRIVGDCLDLGIVPPVNGIYSSKELGSHTLKPWAEELRPVFVIISHMHIDHMGALGLLAPEIPVYMTKDSLELYNALCRMNGEHYGIHTNCIGLDIGEAVSVGNIRAEAIPVDHDVIGACGFKIITPDGTVCYTGDMRLHGFHGESTLEFARQVHGSDVCITEGVTASFIENFDDVVPSALSEGICKTEEQALQEIEQTFRRTSGMVFINMYNRNLERVERLAEYARRTGRTLVLDAQQAFLLKTVRNLELPIYKPFDTPLTKEILALRLDREELQEYPERYVLSCPFPHLLEVKDFNPETSLYIHANGTPLGDYDPLYGLCIHFLAEHGIDFAILGTGGHAPPEHLKYILQIIAPRVLVPLHSLRPEIISISEAEQLLPSTNCVYRLQDHTLEIIENDSMRKYQNSTKNA